MKRDSKLSGVLHLLLHLEKAAAPLTSETLSTMMGTHAVVIRRLLGNLRDQGLVRSDKGHGGGWTLSGDVRRVTLADVYRALGSPAAFTFEHRNENPTCLVEKAVNASLDQARNAAEKVLMKRLEEVTLADLASEIDRTRHAV